MSSSRAWAADEDDNYETLCLLLGEGQRLYGRGDHYEDLRKRAEALPDLSQSEASVFQHLFTYHREATRKVGQALLDKAFHWPSIRATPSSFVRVLRAAADSALVNAEVERADSEAQVTRARALPLAQHAEAIRRRIKAVAAYDRALHLDREVETLLARLPAFTESPDRYNRDIG
jgi:hypothetical protein